MEVELAGGLVIKFSPPASHRVRDWATGALWASSVSIEAGSKIYGPKSFPVLTSSGSSGPVRLVDRRYGKRPLPSDESEEKEEDHIFPVYSARSQQDMTAMVSALAQVIGSSHGNPDNDQVHGNTNPLVLSQSSNTEEENLPQPVQDQGRSELGHLTIRPNLHQQQRQQQQVPNTRAMAPRPQSQAREMIAQHPNPYFYAQFPPSGGYAFNFSTPSHYGGDHTFLSPTSTTSSSSSSSSSSAPQQQQQQPQPSEVIRFPAWFGSSSSTSDSSHQSRRGYESPKRE
ncbi:ethylene-responsive transcription factor [Tripterygium wilfordii]|uniref:Ethylene-responsive transcription factor n=1 Tax=Tripterygium wilfordii TaxID=458696 RepID=A0A7J7DC57_TRIWF|nr:ethylene-responsive transcription factor [Tripterygium wilfordii]